MQRLQAYQFELIPNGQQALLMRRFAGACRFVFNKALALQQSNHADGGKYIGYVEMAKRLTAWRNSQETPWLKDAPAHPLQHALKDLDRAYRNFFEQRAAFPRFKRKRRRNPHLIMGQWPMVSRVAREGRGGCQTEKCQSPPPKGGGLRSNCFLSLRLTRPSSRKAATL